MACLASVLPTSARTTRLTKETLMKKTSFGIVASLAGLSLLLAACGGSTSDEGAAGSDLTGQVRIDGSSTVFPLTGLAAEDFQLENSGVQVTVGSSGTGGGFEKFCRG